MFRLKDLILAWLEYTFIGGLKHSKEISINALTYEKVQKKVLIYWKKYLKKLKNIQIYSIFFPKLSAAISTEKLSF